MINGYRFLSIIPARGGSKRLPRKNVLDFNGKPLICWSIEASLNSKYIDKTIVSSDDEEILKIAEKNGANFIKRPNELANDTSTTFDVLKHTINNLETYDYVIVLQPTSPLRKAKHIDKAIELLNEKKADAIISTCEVEHSPLWSNTLPEDRNMKLFMREELKNKRSQDLEQYFRLNGAIYICNIKKLLEEKTLFLKKNIYSYIMDRYESIDIDEKLDFEIAQFLATKIK